VHFTLAASIESELPALLTNKPPESPSSTLGSGDWTVPPRAFLLGGAYTDEDIQRLKELLEGTLGVRSIPWLRVDSSKPSPPIGPEYAVAVVARFKEVLKKLEAEGKLNEDDGGVYLV
jgi:hypothetical protein